MLTYGGFGRPSAVKCCLEALIDISLSFDRICSVQDPVSPSNAAGEALAAHAQEAETMTCYKDSSFLH